MSATYQNGAINQITTAATTQAATVPSDTVAGMHIIGFAALNITAASGVVPTLPAGYVDWGTTFFGGMSVRLFAKVAVAGDASATVTVGRSDSAAHTGIVALATYKNVGALPSGTAITLTTYGSASGTHATGTAVAPGGQVLYSGCVDKGTGPSTTMTNTSVTVRQSTFGTSSPAGQMTMALGETATVSSGAQAAGSWVGSLSTQTAITFTVAENVSITPVAVAGSTTPFGGAVKGISYHFTASSTPAGVPTKVTAVPVAGSSTPSGNPGKVTLVPVSGSSTPTGALSNVHLYVKALAGSITATGQFLTRLVLKRPSGSTTPAGAAGKLSTYHLGGTSTPAGTAIKRVRKALSGASTPTGALALAHQWVRALAGSSTPTGTAAKLTVKLPSGTSTPTGLIKPRTVTKLPSGTTTPAGLAVKVVKHLAAGTTTPAGALIHLAQRVKGLTASMTPAGVTKHTAQKRPAGSITPTNSALIRAVTKLPSGVIALIGTLFPVKFQRIFGRAGTATLVLAPATEVDMMFYLRHRAQVTVSVVADATVSV